MISSLDFPKLTYVNPEKSLIDKRPPLSRIVGLDSETYTDGTPFMFCTSLNDVIKPPDLFDTLFSPKYVNSNFVLYNMKFDSGSIVRFLPHDVLQSLWGTGKAVHESFRLSYIPHKMLRITRLKEKVTFWDIAQFFKMSLNTASKTYLNKEKIDIPTKSFTRRYVKRFWKYIAKYCVRDATLTAELAEYFIAKLRTFNIRPTAIYSCASISFKYFSDHSKIVTSWRYWNEAREVLAFAVDSYEGGKFEVTSRGLFQGTEYDISSAYPYEIANLVDISAATYKRTAEYQPKAVYGFLRCFIENPEGKNVPCGVMVDGVRIYPAGRYFLTITKAEYDYLVSINVKTTIIDGVWLFVKRKRYPYRKIVADLFKIKSEYKNKDLMVYNTTKICLNSFYGKCVQAIPLHTGRIAVGAGWNPIYGSVITANTRIKVTQIQNMLGNDCLAVHTDSVMVTKPLPESIPQNGLGKFEHVITGKGILVACGMYQLSDDCAFKGFKPNKKDSWETILSRNLTKKRLKYKVLHVESWIEAMAKNHETSCINVFEKNKKLIDLNCDTKRVWMKKVTGRDLLNKLEHSLPKIRVESSPPKYWGVKDAP